MHLRSLFRRKSTTAAPVGPAPDSDVTEDPAPLPPELTAELQEAWADLEEAVKDAKVLNVQACTRNGKDWTADPRTVRAVASMLRKYGSSHAPG